MKITTKEKAPYAIEASIELGPEELASYVQQVAGQAAGSVSVPGFRKGKVPKERAAQAMDERALREEALQAAMEGSFTEAVQKEGWDVAGTADLSVKRNDDSGLAYSVLVTLWPSVTLPDLSSIRIPRKAVVVGDAEVDETLDTLRGLRATFLDKTGPITEGDRVEVDFDSFLDGTALEGGSSKNHPLIVGGKSFMPGFEEQLVGLTDGMSKEFSLTAPADYYEPKLAGKRVDFKVTVRRVQTVLKPAADDAFAKTLGEFKDIAALRASLADGIRKEKEEKEHQRIRLAILDAIAEAAKPPTPEFLVTRELDDMLHRFGHDLEQRGLALPMYLARMNTTEEEVKKGWHADAQRQVRISLVLRQLAKDRSIGVSAEEIEEALSAVVAGLVKEGQDPAKLDAAKLRSALGERMARDKVLAFVEQECATEQA